MVQIQAVAQTARVVGKKREILQAAAAAFRERGFHATAMRDIAGALGMTAGNLYYYFKSKVDILAYCQEDALRRLQALAAWARDGERRADETLYLILQGHVRALNESTPGSMAHLEVESLPAPARRRIQRLRDAYESHLREVVADGIASGVFAPCEVKVAVLAMLGAVNWTARWFRPEGKRTADEIGAQIALQLVRGLLASGIELRVSEDVAPAEFTGALESVHE